MDFDAFNEKLAGLFKAQGENRRRLITYALDEEVFPSDAFKAYPGEFGLQADRIGRLKHLGYVTQLFWVRAFFEYSSGNDPFQALEEALFLSADYREKHDVARNLPFPFKDLDGLLEECWLVGGGKDHELRGKTSKLTKTCSFLTRNLSNPQNPETCWEDIDTILDTQQPDYVPAAVSRLIEARDQDFLNSILAIHSGTGTGWLQRVSKLREGVFATVAADADWTLYKNGNLFKLVLTVRNIFLPSTGVYKLSLRQGGRVLNEQDLSLNREKNLQFGMADLLTADMDAERPVRVRIGCHAVATVISIQDLLQENNVALFRYPLRAKAQLLPRIVSGQHVSARRLVLLSSDAPNELTWGGNSLNVTKCGELMASKSANLWEVNLQDNDKQESLPLKYRNQILAVIGRKPWIKAEPWMLDVSVSGDSTDVTLISGLSATVEICSIPPDSINSWKFDGASQGSVGDLKHEVAASEYGQKIQITYGAAKALLQFLPPRNLWGDSSAEGAFQWVSEPSDTLTISNATRGVEEGWLTLPNEKKLLLERPLESVCWWWKESVFSSGSDLMGSKTFLGYSELSRLMLCVWAPDHDLSLLLKLDEGTQTVELHHLEKGYQTLLLGEFIRGKVPDEAILDAVDELVMGDQKIADVLRAPDRPKLVMKDGDLKVFFPDKDHDPSSFSLLWITESDLTGGKLRITGLSTETFPGQLSDQSIPGHSPDEGVWCMLVRNDIGLLPEKIRDLGYDPLEIEHALCVQDAENSSSLAKRIGIEPNSSEAGRVRQKLDVLSALEWEGFSRWGVFKDSIRDRDALAYAKRDEAWKDYFSSHCALEKTKNSRGMLADTLSLMLRSEYNWCAEPGWFLWANAIIPASQDWQKVTKNRKKLLKASLKELCPMLRPQAAIQAGFPICDHNETSDYGHLTRICNPPADVLRLHVYHDHSVEREGQEFPMKSRHNDPIFGRGGVWADKHHLPVLVNDGQLRVSFGNSHVPFSILLEKGKEQQFFVFMRGNHVPGQEPVLSRVMEESLWTILERMVGLDEDLMGGSEGLGRIILRAIEYYREDEDWLCRAECICTAFLCRWFHHRAGSDFDQADVWAQEDYVLLAKATCQLYAVEDIREHFFEDLIEVDWLIRWFLKGES